MVAPDSATTWANTSACSCARRLAEVGQDRDAVDAAGHEAVDGDGLDRALQLGDLDLELADLELEPLPVELEQRQPRLGGQERLGRVVGALTRGGDLGRGLLGGVLVGLGDDRSGDDGDRNAIAAECS